MPTLPPPYTTTSDVRSAIIGGEVMGHHILDIEGYSHIKEQLRRGDSTSSLAFTIGGCSWYISYYPNGCPHSADGFMGIFLVLLERHQSGAGADGRVKTRVKFSLLDRAGKPVPSHSHTTVLVFDRSFDSADYPCCFGFPEFLRREDLEKSEHLEDDRLTIRCDITIANNRICKERRRAAHGLVKVPPSDLHQHLGHLLVSKQGADVTFHVAGEMFRAHRYILAARSPVFLAELLGPMRESRAAAVVEIEDMEAQAFQALLEFVYTDALPQDMTPEEEAVICQHLLVAADRYSMERLKLVCEDRLCRHITVASVAIILALAEQHRCHGLKEACLQFLESPSVLNAVAAADGFDHLANTCPSVLKDLILKLTNCHLDLWGKH